MVSGNKKGMTLIEAIIAMAMLGILLVAFMGAYVSGFGWVYDSGVLTQEDYVDQQTLDKALGYSGSATAASQNFTMVVNGLSCSVPGDRLTSGPFVVFRPD